MYLILCISRKKRSLFFLQKKTLRSKNINITNKSVFYLIILQRNVPCSLHSHKNCISTDDALNDTEKQVTEAVMSSICHLLDPMLQSEHRLPVTSALCMFLIPNSSLDWIQAFFTPIDKAENVWEMVESIHSEKKKPKEEKTHGSTGDTDDKKDESDIESDAGSNKIAKTRPLSSKMDLDEPKEEIHEWIPANLPKKVVGLLVFNLILNLFIIA